MAKCGRLTPEGLVLEVCCDDPGCCFVAALAEQFVEIPEDAEPGDTIVDGVAVKPEPPAEPEPPVAADRVLTRETILAQMTRSERLALKTLAATDAEVEDMLEVMASTNHLNIDDPENEELLTRLTSDGVLSQATFEKIYS